MQKFDNMIKEIIMNYDDEVEKALRLSARKNIVIFGAGQLGHRVNRVLNERGISIEYFCDNNLSGQIDVQTGLKIISINEIKAEMETIFVLIAVFDPKSYDIVYHQLLGVGFREGQLFNAKNIAERLQLSYLNKNMEKYRSTYSILEDDYSKEVYLNMVKKAYLDQDISQIARGEEEQYFDDNIFFTEEEVFVDGGGYDGETAARFADKTNGKYKKIIIFEPEESKKELIKKNLGNHEYDLYSYGLWSCNTILRFDARGNSASAIYEYGDTEVTVKSLDKTVFQDAPTYIKMDIEGAETEALKGCGRIIEKYKPKLAICIYHKPEDLFAIPLLIKELHKEYRLFIRKYTNTKYETVCYAI